MKYGMTDRELNQRRYAETAVKQNSLLRHGIKIQKDLRATRRVLMLADELLATLVPGMNERYERYCNAYEKATGHKSRIEDANEG